MRLAGEGGAVRGGHPHAGAPRVKAHGDILRRAANANDPIVLHAHTTLVTKTPAKRRRLDGTAHFEARTDIPRRAPHNKAT